MNGFDEEDGFDIANDTSADVLDKGREASSDALANMQGLNGPTFSDDEMRGHFNSGTDYSQSELDSMTDDQYARYSQIAKEYNGNALTPEPQPENEPQSQLKKMLDLSDELERKAKYVLDETDGDEEWKNTNARMQNVYNAVSNHKTNFANASSEDISSIYNYINDEYEKASKRRGHLETAWDALKRGVTSVGNMIYQGGYMLKPGELSDEDRENIEASLKVGREQDEMSPQRVGGVENIHSVGDAIDWLAESTLENAPRMAVTMAATTAGAIVGGPVGAIVMGTLGTMALNTGEAVQDQNDENVNDGDIRNGRGWALLQGLGYSLLDGAFGVSAWGAKMWSNVIRKAGVKKLAETAETEWAKNIVKNSTLKGVGKDLLINGVLGEGLQEAAQSQIVGRGRRYFQTGSIFRKDAEKGTYETPGDAFLEAVNEFAGGAAAGITFGILGGAGAHVNARRTLNAYNKIEDALNGDKTYQSLDDYAKLLVKRHLINDSFLATTEVIDPKILASLEQSNRNIDNEITRMIKAKGDESVVGQNARSYLDIFKSQYALEDLGSVAGQAESEGFSSSLDNASEVDAMRNSLEEYQDEKTGTRYNLFTSPSTGISIAQILDADGNPTGKYLFNNNPNYKSPVLSDKHVDDDGKRTNELMCDNLEDAFEKARQLDLYNQWREKRMADKKATVERVFDNLYGGRDIKLRFVDRPTAGAASVGTTVAGYDHEHNTVEVSLDKIDNLGSLYTALIHERSHKDIVDFLRNLPTWKEKYGDAETIDWDKFEEDRAKLLAGVKGAKEKYEKFRRKNKETGKEEAVTDWGRSQGYAGEELLAELNSVYELATQFMNAERGVFGSLEDKIRSAIGMKMANDLGLDPRLIMGDIANNVRSEMAKLFEIGYLKEANPVVRGEAEYEVKDDEGLVKTAAEFKAGLGKRVSSEPTVDENDILHMGGTVNKGKAAAPAPESTDNGTTVAKGANIKRADGALFSKTGDNSWVDVKTGEEVDDAAATKGGYTEIKAKTAKASVSKASAAPADVKINKNSAQVDKKTPEKAAAKATNGVKTVQIAQNTEAAEPKATAKESLAVPKAEATTQKPAEKKVETTAQEPVENAPQSAPSEKGVTSQAELTEAPKAVPEASGAKVEEKPAEKPAPEVAKTETKNEPSESPKAQKAVPEAPVKSEKKEPVRANPDTDTVTVEQGKTEQKEPVTVDVKTDTVTVASADNGALRRMPVKEKNEQLKAIGLSSVKPEVEDRYVRLGEMPVGTKVSVKSKRFTKTSDGNWVDKDGKARPQLLLAKDGKYSVVENKGNAVKSEPKAEKKAEKATQAEEAAFGSADSARKLIEEAAKKRLAEAEKRLGTDKKSTGSAKEDREARNIERIRKQREEAAEAIDVIGLPEGVKPLTKAQRDGIIDCCAFHGSVVDIKPISIPGVVLAIYETGNEYFLEDGQTASVEELMERKGSAHGKTVLSHAKTVLLKYSDLDGRELAEKYVRSGGKSHSSLSDQALFDKAVSGGDYEYTAALWYRWAVNPPARLNGGLRKWFHDRGVSDAKMGKALDLAWRKYVDRMVEAGEVRKSVKGTDAAIGKILEDERAKAKDNGYDEGRLRVSEDEKADKSVREEHTRTGLASVNQMFYTIANEILPFTKDEYEAANEERRIMEEANAKWEAERFRRIVQDDLIGERKANDYSAAIGTSRVFVGMSDGVLASLCIPHDGMRASVGAQSEAVSRLTSAVYNEKADEKDRISYPLLNAISRILQQAGISTAYSGEVLDKVISEIKDEWNNPDGFHNERSKTTNREFWSGFASDDKFSIMNYAIGVAKNVVRGMDNVFTYSDNKTTETTPIAADYEVQRHARSASEIEKVIKAGNAILGSGLLAGEKKVVLKALVNTFRDMENSAELAVQEAAEAGRNTNRLLNALDKVRHLSFQSDEVYKAAATLAGMRDGEYLAKLKSVLDSLGYGFMNDKMFRKLKTGKKLTTKENAERRRLLSGDFEYDAGEVDAAMKRASVVPEISLLDYDLESILEHMAINGDDAMAEVVKMAEDGKTNVEIHEAIKSGKVDLSKMDSAHDTRNFWRLLDKAYEDYGWIDRRLSDDAHEKYRNAKGLFMKLADEFVSRLGTGYPTDLDSPVFRLIGDWITRNGMRDKFNADLLRRLFNHIITQNPEAVKRKNDYNRQLAKDDHTEVSLLMDEFAGSEIAVREQLKEDGNSDKRVKSMLTHWRAEEKYLSEAAQRELERANRDTQEVGLTVKQKNEAVNAFNANQKSVVHAKKDLAEAGWDEASLDKAQDYLNKLQSSLAKSEDERLRSLPPETKRMMIEDLIKRDGEDYVDDETVIKEAVRIGMSPLMAKMMVNKFRPEVKETTPEELAKIAASRGFVQNVVDDEEIAKETLAKAESDLKEAQVSAESLSKTIRKRDEKFREAMKESGKKGVQAFDAAKDKLGTQGLNADLYAAAFGDVEKARQAVRNAEAALEKAKEKLSNASDKKDGSHHKTVVKATFMVNYGVSNEDVTVSAVSMRGLINAALKAACEGRFYKFYDIQLEPKVINGEKVDGVGVITADDRADKEKMSSLSRTFGFERPAAVSNTPAVVTGGASRNTTNRTESIRVEPLDAEEAQLFREGRMHYKSKESRGLPKHDEMVYSRGDMKENGVIPDDMGGRPTRKDAENDKEAERIRASGKLGEIIERGKAGGMLDEAQVRALQLEHGNRVHDALYRHLTDKELNENEEVMDNLLKAILESGSAIGAALRQFQRGFNFRTRDTAVYLKRRLRAQLEKQARDEFGPTGDQLHSQEIDARMKEFESQIEEYEAEAKKLHDRLDKANAEVAKMRSEANGRDLKRIESEAKREGYEEGYNKANDEWRKRRSESVGKFVSEFGFSEDQASLQFSIGGELADALGIRTSFAGNPERALNARIRNLFSATVKNAGDFDRAANVLAVQFGANWDSVVRPLFEQFHAEELAKADSEVVEEDASAPSDSEEQRENKRNRAMRKSVERQAKKVSIPVSDDSGIDAEEIFSGDPGTARVKIAPEIEKNSPKAVGYIRRLEQRVTSAAVQARSCSDDATAMALMGEAVRNLFKLRTVIKPEESVDAKLARIADYMNGLLGIRRFDSNDAMMAVLGEGEFAPIRPQKVTAEAIRKAKALLEKGKIREAAEAVGIKNDVTDVDILVELEKRISKALDKQMNQWESRINEDGNEEMVTKINELISALKDIHSGAKTAGTLLDDYLDLAEGMKDYRRQKSLLERIKSRIDIYERKLATNDFEPTPKREKIDDAKQVVEVQAAMRRLERLRKQFKREQESWKLSKSPLGSRAVSSIFELLGEVKAVVGSMDFSSFLRQGGQMTWAHPLLAVKNFKRMAMVFRDEEKAQALFNEIWSRPNAKYYAEAGIQFTDWGPGSLGKEDAFLLNKYRMFTNQRFIKAGIQASERAFAMYLNLMRADLFDAMVACSPRRVASEFTTDELKTIGNYINVASQRGTIEQQGKLGQALKALNTVLWSPRNLISRFQFIIETGKLVVPGFNPYGAKNAMMRKMLAWETARYLTGVAAAVVFTKFIADLFRGDDEPPEDVVTDPTSSDFLKVKIGNTRLDFLSGLQQIMVFSSRLITHKTTNLRGETKEIKNPSDYYGLIGRFLRSKMSPAASFVWDTTLMRETFDRQDISYDWRDQLTNDKEKIGFTRYLSESLFSPLVITDIIDQAKYSGVGRAPITWALTALGAGVQAFDPYSYKQLSDDFRYFKKLYNEADTDEERRKIEEYHPMLRRAGSIEAKIREINQIKRDIKKYEKSGVNADKLYDRLEREQKRAINLMAGFDRPMDTE